MTRVEQIEAEIRDLYQSKSWSIEKSDRLNALRASWLRFQSASA